MPAKFLTAQVNDAGMWINLGAEKKITRALSVTLTEVVKSNLTVPMLSEYYTEAGLTYKITPNIKISLSYRFVNKLRNNKPDNYFMHHVLNFDLTLRKKWKPILVQFRTRLEDEFSRQARSKDEDNGQLFCWRNKLDVKLDYFKKFTPYIFAEGYTPLNEPDLLPFDEYRYCLGTEYKLNRRHSFDLFFMIKHATDDAIPETNYITGIGYEFTF
jgi:hypothetical protein